jgi:hypothetical protein
MNYKDNETGIEHGVTLNGAGLTNRPFVKGMNPILSEISAMIDKSPEKIDDIQRILSNGSKKGNEIMNYDEIKKALVSVQLSDDQKNEVARLINVEDKSAKLSEEIQVLKTTVSAKDQEIQKLSDENKNMKKEAEFSVLLSEGKAVPAQKAAYLSGDMAEFVKLSVAVNLSAKGTGNGDQGNEPKTAEEAEAKVIVLAEKKREADKNLTLEQSIGLVLSENPALKKLLA